MTKRGSIKQLYKVEGFYFVFSFPSAIISLNIPGESNFFINMYRSIYLGEIPRRTDQGNTMLLETLGLSRFLGDSARLVPVRVGEARTTQ